MGPMLKGGQTRERVAYDKQQLGLTNSSVNWWWDTRRGVDLCDRATTSTGPALGTLLSASCLCFPAIPPAWLMGGLKCLC
jgi:hypothetical protein